MADLSLARNFILSGMKRDSKLSQDSFLGIILLVSIVDLPPNCTDVAIVVEYRHHAYDIVN